VAYRVEITRLALREIDRAFGWLAERSPASAARWHRQLLDAIGRLKTNPERCPLAPESEWYAGGQLRQLLHGRRQSVYRILFEVRGTTVYILRIRHGAQDLLSPDEL
jgi:plasmid stabilization system protein ParE